MSWQTHKSGDGLSDFFAKCDENGRSIRALGAQAGTGAALQKGQFRVVDAATAGWPTFGFTGLQVVQQINDSGAAVNRWRVGVPFSNERVAHFESFTAGVKLDTDFIPSRVFVQMRRHRAPGPVADGNAIMFHAPQNPFLMELPLFAFNSGGSGRLEATVTCDFEADGVTIDWSGDESTVTAAGVTVAGVAVPAALTVPEAQRVWSPVNDQLPLELADALELQNDNLRALRDLHYGMDEPVEAPLYSLWANPSAGYVFQLSKASPRVWTRLWPLEQPDAIAAIAAGTFAFGVGVSTGWRPRAVLACMDYMIQGRGTGQGNVRDSCSLLFVRNTDGSKSETIAVGQNENLATNLAAVTIACNFGASAFQITKSGGGGTGLASVTPRGVIAWG